MASLIASPRTRNETKAGVLSHARQSGHMARLSRGLPTAGPQRPETTRKLQRMSQSEPPTQPRRPLIEWAVSSTPVAYEAAVAEMEMRARRVAGHEAAELVWLLEHPPLYTAGTRARAEDLLDAGRFPVHTTGRGGELTYHGPGQRIVYVVLDVRARFGGDIGRFISTLEELVIAAVAELGLRGRRVAGRTGVWVEAPGRGLAKIAAAGLRIRRGVSMHGLALNVAPDLSHYEGIVPCGIRDAGVTSLEALSVPVAMKDVDKRLLKHFEVLIGPVRPAPPPTEG